MAAEAPSLTHDPVCGSHLEAVDTAVLTSYRGELFAFCSYRCLSRFSEDPESYLREEKDVPHRTTAAS